MSTERSVIYSYKQKIEETKPIYFPHISKTGGTTFTGILFSLAVGLEANYTFIPEIFGQFHLPLVTAIPKDSLVYAGHCKYNFYVLLPQEINRVSLIRNPIDRVVSEYFWVHRESENEQYLAQDKDFFIKYLKNCTTSNLCCRHLSADDRISWKSTEIAIEEIEKSFCFGTTENIKSMASYILSKYNSPSVVIENAKVNTDLRKSYFIDSFSEYILDFNQFDYGLYKYVKKQEEEQRFEPEKDGLLNTVVVYAQNISGKNFKFRSTSIKEFE